MATTTDGSGGVFGEGVLHSPLHDGLKILSNDQRVVFTKYRRYVLPLDGYVFWIKEPGSTITAGGSLHYVTEQQQNVDETQSVNRVIFTSDREITDFNEVSQDTTYLGVFDGLRFTFNQRGSYYQETGTHHYVGDAVYPVMETQLLDSAADIPLGAVLGNSTAFWLALNKRVPVYTEFLVPSNLAPPYAVVSIRDTEPLQVVPNVCTLVTNGIESRFSQQLLKDTVVITTYGLNNSQAIDYLNYIVSELTLYGDSTMGLMNAVAVKDVVRVQSELSVRAQKKEILFEVSYLQSSVITQTIQLIKHAIPSYDIAYTFTGPGWRVPA